MPWFKWFRCEEALSNLVSHLFDFDGVKRLDLLNVVLLIREVGVGDFTQLYLLEYVAVPV